MLKLKMPNYNITYADDTKEKVFKKNRDELDKWIATNDKEVILVRHANSAVVIPSKRLHDQFD